MYSLRRTIIQLVALLVFCAGALPQAGMAEEPGPAPPKPADHADENKPLRDPTAASDKLKAALRGPEKPAPVAKPAPTLPQMSLKGIVRAKGKEAAAMIEIKGGGLATVQAGSQLSVTRSDGQTEVLTVRHVSSEAVELDSADRKNPIVVR